MTNESTIKVSESGDVLVVTALLTTFDARNSKEFRTQTEKAISDRTQVVLDLAAVEFMDSSALGTLIPLLRSITARGGDLRLAGLQDRVQMLFELTRLYRVFSIWPDVDAAVASFAA